MPKKKSISVDSALAAIAPVSNGRGRAWRYFEGKFPASKERYIANVCLGKLGILPTDTLYGLVCCAENKRSVNHLYRIRKRDAKKACIILLSQAKEMERFDVSFNACKKQIAKAVWPGPVSVIFPCDSQKLAYLHRGTNRLAFRVPDNPTLLSILKRTGPLIAPSANFEGESVAETIAQAREMFGEKVSVWADAGCLQGKPSTLIAYENDGIVLKREGVTPFQNIVRKMQRIGL